MGSDTEEEKDIPIKSKNTCKPSTQIVKYDDYFDSDYEFDAAYRGKVQYISLRKLTESSTSASTSKATLAITPVPYQHFKEITPRVVVKELVTFYVPPLSGKRGPGSFL